MAPNIEVALEEGKRWTFASAIDHPGWTWRGKGADDALAALIVAGPRYAKAVRSVRTVTVPATVAGLRVAETLAGDSSTDFGAPGKPPTSDAKPMNARDTRTWIGLLEASWNSFGDAARAATKVQLRTGPRGGGRDIERMWEHVVEAQHAYLQALGAKFDAKATGRESLWKNLQSAFIDALGARQRGELPDIGPRGGIRWSARYAIRRSAWHALDHAWEIEDRAP